MERFTHENFDAIANDALHAACKYIQDQIGEIDGGFASHYFSGIIGDKIEREFAKYAEANYENLFPDMDKIMLKSSESLNKTFTLREWINVNTEQAVTQITISEINEVANLAVGEKVEFFYGAGGLVTIKRVE